MSVSVGIVVACDMDGCPSVLDTGLGDTDTREAVRRALAAGWSEHHRRHYCPRCTADRARERAVLPSLQESPMPVRSHLGLYADLF